MKKVLLLACSFIIGSLFLSIPAYAEEVCYVSGNVKDTKGNPIANATVVAVTSTSPHVVKAATVTDMDGKYSMKVPPGFIIKFQVSALGYIYLETTPETIPVGSLVRNYTLHEEPEE